jgi:hypothetical protein
MALTLPVLAVLAVVGVLTGMHELFEWSHEAVVASDPVLREKQPYLNATSFTMRAVIYGVVWSGLGVLLWWWSVRQDKEVDPNPIAHKQRWIGPLGIVLTALSLTFGAFDWLMSLDPHWFSTIFGVYYFAGCVVTSHAFLAMIVILLHRSGYLRGVVTPEHFHDLGKMMFAFTVFWAYIGFSQYMLIWYASIPEETEWFAYRGHGQYLALSLVLVFGRFAIPFVGLMSRRIKRNPKTLMFWSIWIIIGEFIDMYWLIHPALAHHRGIAEPVIRPDVFDVTTLLGIGGIFFAVFAWATSKYPLVPVKDPRLEESINFENF